MKRLILGLAVLLLAANIAQAAGLDKILGVIKVADEPVLLVICEDGCRWCKKQEKVLAKPDFSSCLYIQSKDKAVVKHFHVDGFPTLILFNRGKEVRRHEGFLNAVQLKKFLRQ